MIAEVVARRQHTFEKTLVNEPVADGEALALQREALSAFADDVYLHQCVVRTGGALTRFIDLPDALTSETAGALGSEWRVHFHVPLFRAELGAFESTRSDLPPLLAALHDEAEVPHLEVETYTWGVLPAEFRDRPVTDAIVRELQWVRSQL